MAVRIIKESLSEYDLRDSLKALCYNYGLSVNELKQWLKSGKIEDSDIPKSLKYYYKKQNAKDGFDGDVLQDIPNVSVEDLLKYIGKSESLKSLKKESFDFNSFQKKCRSLRSQVADLTMDIEDVIDTDLYDKDHGVQGEREMTPGIADKVCDELQEISGLCDSIVKTLIDNYNL